MEGGRDHRAFTAAPHLNENKTHLNFFITQTSLKRVAGLGGMISDPQRVFETLNVVGPPGISHYMASMRFHLFRDSVQADVKETKMVPNLTRNPTPCFQDDNITVYGIPILPMNGLAVPDQSEGTSTKKDIAWRDRVIILRRLGIMFPEKRQTHWPLDHPFNNPDHSFNQQLPSLYPPDSLPTMAYVAVLHPFDLKSLGEREALTYGDNTTPPLNLTVVIILDVPSPSYVASLLDSFTRSPLYRDGQSQSPKYTIHSIFHLCGDGVLDDARYVEFMNNFPRGTNHIISSPEHDRDLVTFENVHQSTMNRLDPVVFPGPKFSPEPKKGWSEISGLPANSFPLEPGLALHIRPSLRPAVFFPPPVKDPTVTQFDLSPSALKEFEKVQEEARTTDWGYQRMLLRRSKEGRDSSKYGRLRGRIMSI
ncbi:hypothetical protein MVEN_01039300 [Mycena venus]|uniref:Uncharacterized protein n=1 Tax=Mycena venus TaxID=2733690 RepID=A0A8H7D2I1_9AGAR|nr:hypothetical protein MVEN_01039300 [Mycena venus]